MLSGHTLPDAGAVLKHDGLNVRVVLSWDACAPSPTRLRHEQVTPNHLLYELAGQPLFGDGEPAHDEGFLDTSLEDVAAHLTAGQRDEVAREFGSVETWARRQQPGLIGAANTIVLDGESGYFPPGARRGRLVHEDRSPALHVVTAECVDFFHPRYDLTRARRTVALAANGVAWIVDDYHGASDHHFAWQAYLRRGCSLGDHHLRVRLPGGASATLGWSGATETGLHRFPTYPAASTGNALGWPDAGSERLRLGVAGQSARFIVCVIPWRADELRVGEIDRHRWHATWAGASASFDLPAACRPVEN